MLVGGYYIPTQYKSDNVTTMNTNMGSNPNSNANVDKNQLKIDLQQQINQKIEDEQRIQADISNLTNIGRILNIKV